MQVISRFLAFRISLLIVTAISIWTLGLFLFIYSIPSTNIIKPDKTDAIVILTGGALRLEEGLNAFTKYKSKKLLISGVGDKVTFNDITRLMNNNYSSHQLNVVLGNIATSTLTNAKETRVFMELNNYESLRVVTSSYHLPRTKLIFKYVMPGLNIIYHPVMPSNLKDKFDYLAWQNFFIIVKEYNKYIVTLFIIKVETLSTYWDICMVFIATFLKHIFLKLGG